MIKYRKTLLIMAVLMSVCALGIVARNQQQDTGFKNLQVFPKNISNARMDKEMELFSKSLGVECGYCHVKTANGMDFASDANGHKQESRNMMRMTNELNAKFFGADTSKGEPYQTMNCYTCHRGEEFPVISWDTSGVKGKEKKGIMSWH